MFYDMSLETEELKKGNIEICELIGSDGVYDVFHSLKSQEEKDELLSIILPKLKATKNWYNVADKIFNVIYLNPKYDEYTLYLLQTNLEKTSYLTFEQIADIMTKKSWGLSYIMKNLEKIINSKKVNSDRFIELLVNHVKNNQELLNECLKRFLYTKNPQLRETAIFYLVKNNLLPDKKLVVAALYKNPEDFFNEEKSSLNKEKEPEFLLSDLPFLISQIADEDKKYKELIDKYYRCFFNAESKRKLHLVREIGYILPEIKERYQEIFRFAEDPMVMTNLDFILSTVINANEESFISDYIMGKDVVYEGMGTTRKVFKVGEEHILKFARSLHRKNNVTKHFLLAPNDIRIISVGNFAPVYIERENYLSKYHNGKYMTEKDIDNFLAEAEKQGLEISDPHCLSKEKDNFGFLKSYKDATLVGVKNHDELPEWFKERPLVLYDIDMVSYKEGAKTFIKKTK